MKFIVIRQKNGKRSCFVDGHKRHELDLSAKAVSNGYSIETYSQGRYKECLIEVAPEVDWYIAYWLTDDKQVVLLRYGQYTVTKKMLKMVMHSEFEMLNAKPWPVGVALLPREPTRKMMEAGAMVSGSKRVYMAMVNQYLGVNK